MCCCFGAQENRDLSQSLLGDQKHVTKVESNAFITGMKELHVTGAVIPSCWKRYSDFEAMHLRMMEDQPHMLAAYSVVLPPKNIGNARDAKEMRRQHLEEYMRRVVASASLLYSNHLQHFVDSEPPIVEQLAACATDQQRNIKELWKARLKEDMARKCATPNPGGSSAADLGRNTPSSQYSSGSIPRSRSLGLGGGALPDIVSLLTPQQPRVVEVEVPHHDLATAQIMQMFDIKGGAKVRMGFNIARIARIENAELRSAYREGVAPVTAAPNRFTLPCPVTNSMSNEALLFCTTAPDAIDTVADRGFMKEERHFGNGIYFLDNAMKGADAPAKAITSPSRFAAHLALYKSADIEEFTLLIARVTLGDPCILLQVQSACSHNARAHAHAAFFQQALTTLQPDSSLSSPPQPQRGGFFSKRDEGPSVFHSTVGESKVYDKNASNLYREYIVYNEHQAYPEYKVTYTMNK